MLTWNQSTSGHPDFHADLGPADPARIEAAVAAAWARLLDLIDTPASGPWEIVLAYLVVEVGEILLYPAPRAEPNRPIGVPSVQLRVADWAAQYAAMSDLLYERVAPDDPAANPSPAAAARFEREYNAQLKRMARAVKDALADPALAPRMAALKQRDGFAVYYVDQGDDLHAVNLRYLWGRRPPALFPSGTPRELFTALLRRAGLSAEYSLKCEGDQVIEATFFGNEFDPSCVEILESIPAVGVLCGRLRALHLHHTRIGPAGVERLKAILPGVRIKVKP